MADVYRPYSDGQMDYDATRHRYRLTPEYVLNELGIDLDSQLASGNAADRGRNPGIFLRRVSDQLAAVKAKNSGNGTSAERPKARRKP